MTKTSSPTPPPTKAPAAAERLRGLSLPVAVWLIGLIPLADSLRRGLPAGMGGQLHMTAEMGTWSLRFLVAALAVAPLAAALRRPALRPLARELGLLGFVYALAHGTAVAIVGRIWLWRPADLLARGDFIPGAAALILLALAAAASVPGAEGRLGVSMRRRMLAASLWAAPLAALHYAMPVGLDVLAPYAYGAVALGLIAWRFAARRRAGRDRQAAKADAP